MARVALLLCVCLCFQLVFCQFGFFPREERRFPPQYGFAQNLVPNINRLRNTLNNILHPQSQNPDVNRNQYDQNAPQYPNNRPNNVRFPNQGQGINGPYDNLNRPNPEFVRPVDNPRDEETGYGFDNGANNEQLITNSPEVNKPDRPYYDDPVNGVQSGPAFGNDGTNVPIVSGVHNGPTFGNEGSNGLISGSVQNVPAFGQNNPSTEAPTFVKPAIPDEEPVKTTTELPMLTPVPDSESRNNYNFGAAGIFKEICTTVDNGDGSCISIKLCEPYIKLLEQSKTNSAVVQVLRKAQCGFDGSTPKVCCPLPGFPDKPPTETISEVPTQPPNPVTSAPIETASGKSLSTDLIEAFPSPPECGLSNASFGRVVGGIDAQLGDFPWMALLGYKGKRSPTTSWLCGGSLITHHHVLTAAHCIHNHEVDLYVVRVGELDLAREDDGATPVDVLIKSKIKHENYDPKAYTNDIGLLVLQNDVQFTDLIRPICIPMDDKLRSINFEDYRPFIAGWGDLEFRGPKATHLQVLQLPVVSNDFCRQAYAAYKAQVIDERTICAGYKKGGKDSCQGDSGGPLMQPIYNSKNLTTYIYQIGVVSFGKKCAEPGFPGVYSRVTNFVPWLEEKILGIA